MSKTLQMKFVILKAETTRRSGALRASCPPVGSLCGILFEWVSKSRREPIAPHVVQFTPDMLVEDDPFFERRSGRPIMHDERAHAGFVGCRDVKTLNF